VARKSIIEAYVPKLVQRRLQSNSAQRRTVRTITCGE